MCLMIEEIFCKLASDKTFSLLLPEAYVELMNALQLETQLLDGWEYKNLSKSVLNHSRHLKIWVLFSGNKKGTMSLMLLNGSTVHPRHRFLSFYTTNYPA